MAWWWQMALTTGGMLLVMAGARLGGRRVAGVLAALPTITGPTLAWTAAEHGTPFAVHAAIGSVATCAALAMFALAYVHASRRFGPLVSLACGLAAAALATVPAQEVAELLPSALMLALGASVLAWVGLPARCAAASGALRASRPPWLAALAVGALTTIATTLGPALGPFATGLIASLPLVSGPIAIAEHASAGRHASTEFLRGYVLGLFGKAAFGALFALFAPCIGPLPALALAVAAACALGLRPAGRDARAPLLHSTER